MLSWKIYEMCTTCLCLFCIGATKVAGTWHVCYKHIYSHPDIFTLQCSYCIFSLFQLILYWLGENLRLNVLRFTVKCYQYTFKCATRCRDAELWFPYLWTFSLFYQNIISAIRLEAAQWFLILKTESHGRMSATGNKCS